MSKRESDDRDFSQASDSLFRASRADHDPTASDRARVRLSLARRLAAGASLTPDGGARVGATKALRAATVGNILRISLGVACVAAGAFVFTRGDNRRPDKPDTTDFASHAQPATLSKPAEPSLELGSRETPASSSAPPSARTRTSARSRGVLPRAHADTDTAEASVNTAQARSDAAPGAQQPAATKGVAPERNVSATSESAVSSAASSRNVSVPRTEPASVKPTATVAAADPAHHDQLDDARAELSLVERIHLAMRNGSPSDALALCAEHERRWPHGTFAQEREGVRAIASCESHSNEAGSRARAFLARYTHATLAPRVASACAAQLATSAQDRATPGVD